MNQITQRNDQNEIKTILSIFNNDFLDLAERIIKVQPICYDKHSLFWIWDKIKYKWRITDGTDIMNMICTKSNIMSTTRHQIKQEMMEGIQRKGRELFYELKPPNKYWVQFGNMIYDIKRNKKFSVNSNMFITNPIGWKIGTTDKTPILDKLFEEWVGKDYVQTLYEIIAYCLIPFFPLQRIFCLNGQGSNGKSTYLTILKKFLGIHNCCSSDLDILINNRFESTNLYKKLMCEIAETNFNVLSKTEQLKRLTGNDSIRYEFKHKDIFNDVNYAKIIISTNRLPITKDDTIGFFRRWLIIDFPNQFHEKKDILSQIPDSEFENLARKSFMIAREIIKNPQFTNEGTIEDRIKKYKSTSTMSLGNFIEQNFIKDVESKVKFADFYELYNSFLSQLNLLPVNKKRLSQELISIGFNIERKLERIDRIPSRTTLIYGIRPTL